MKAARGPRQLLAVAVLAGVALHTLQGYFVMSIFGRLLGLRLTSRSLCHLARVSGVRAAHRMDHVLVSGFPAPTRIIGR